MPRRFTAAIAFTIACLLLAAFGAVAVSDHHPPPADNPHRTELLPGAHWTRDSNGLGRPDVHLDLRLIAAAQDPCYDYDQLEAGTGDPVRQDTFNHLDARGYARWRMACVYGWPGGDPNAPAPRTFACVEQVWDEESSWYQLADGPNGPAGNTWGIPQAYPGDKMASAARPGEDWTSNPRVQVRWGLGYINDAYWAKGRPLPHGCHAGY